MTTINNELLQFFFEDVQETLSSVDEHMRLLKQARNHKEAEPQMEALGVLTHRLRGTAGLYGFPQTSQLASLAERLLMPRPELPKEWHAPYNDLVEEILNTIRRAVENAKAGRGEGNVGLNFARTGGGERMTEILMAHPLAFRLHKHTSDEAAPLAEDDLPEAENLAAEEDFDTNSVNAQLLKFIAENKEVWEYFAPEVRENIDALLLGLGEENPDINALFRSAHTIKGSAYMVGVQPMGMLAHRMEDLLGAIRDEQQEFDTPVIETLEKAADTIVSMIDIDANTPPLAESLDRLGIRLQLLAGGHEWSEVIMREAQHQAESSEEKRNAAEAVNREGPSLEQQVALFGRDNAEVMSYFAPEVQEHIEALHVEIEKSEPDIDALFRSAHTIKGSAYMVGLQTMGDFAHRLEDMFGAVRDEVQRLDMPTAQLAEEATNILARMLSTASGEPVSFALESEIIGERLRLLALGRSWESIHEAERAQQSEKASPAAAIGAVGETLAVRTSVRVDVRRLEDLMDQVGDMVVARARLENALNAFAGLQSALDQAQERFNRTVLDFEERYLNPDMVTDRTATEQRALADGTDLGEQFDELELDTYNDLNILARSMIELSADFAEVRGRFEHGLRALQEGNEDLAKLTRRLRLDLSRTSRVPFSTAAGRLRRWAREREHRLQLVIDGESTEVDTAVLQQLSEPLLHLLNNAASHGIQSAEMREEVGKPAIGTITVRVQEVGNFLEVSVEDDGDGLDHDAIRIRALEKGLRSAQELQEMSKDDIARLILLPGLSTAQSVSAEAGRGVGMDIVSNTLRQMGGELLIRTQAGVGTNFIMRLPTNQRIAELLTCRVGRHEVSFSADTIRTLEERPAGDIVDGPQGWSVVWQGRELPVVDLRRIWGAEVGGKTVAAVILQTVTGEICALVDEFIGIDETAVGHTGNVLSQLDYLAGTAISPEGEPMPILDPAGLLRLARRREMWLRGSHQVEQQNPTNERVLLVDDSLSVRRLVSRMLVRGGYDVTTANDGQEAVDILQLDNDFDLVISDLEMPRMNGYELLSSIRGRPATSDLPLVVMTTRAGDKHQKLAFQLGANDYFSKPVDEALLLRRIRSILSASA